MIHDIVLDISKSTLNWKGNSVDLTKNELRIMHCLFQNKNKIVSRNELMQHMWDCDLFVDDNTLTAVSYTHLDEHTAALDPKTSDLIIHLTDKIVKEKKMTTIMITHNLKHAITYGDRLLMFHKGDIILDIKGEEKKTLTVEKLIEKFNSLNMIDALDDELAFSVQ